MTIVQTMLKRSPTRCSVFAAVVLGMLAAIGCTRQRGVLEVPEVLVVPYDSSRGDVLWAVVPLVNESGVSFVDPDAVSDALIAKISEVRGLSCLPLNRTYAALRAMGSRPIGSPAHARMIANALGVDGLIVGTITAYDPYNPPKLGLNLALFTRDAADSSQTIDPFAISIQYTDFVRRVTTQYNERPASVVSLHLDGANHEVLSDLRRYQVGRHDTESALGWRTALMSMDLYTGFAAQQAVGRLLDTERLRLAQPPAPERNGREAQVSAVR